MARFGRYRKFGKETFAFTQSTKTKAQAHNVASGVRYHGGKARVVKAKTKGRTHHYRVYIKRR